MRRKSRFNIAMVAGLAMIAAACGSSDDDAATDTTAIEADAPAETDAAPAETDAAPAETDAAPAVTDAPEVTEELEASDIGVTEDTIRIGVAVSDLEAVRAAGISIPDTLTTEHLFNRWNVFAEKWNADGGINGRQVELVQLVWDPLNPATFDTLCATATVDEELFMVLNGSGLSAIAQQCIVDSGIPIMYGDVVSQTLLDSGLVIALAPPAEVVARAGVEAWADNTDIAPGAKIGVLANNSPLISAAGAAAAEVLTELGYEPQVIETNSLAGDNAATQEEAAAGVGTFLANGVEHVLVATPFTENGGFWAAAAGQIGYTLLDTNASQCSQFGLSRAPAGAAGGSCVTSYDHPTSEGAGVRPDTEFEAECRAFYDESFSDYYGGPSNAGVPAGQKITDADGKVLISDYPPSECTIANILFNALSNAGVNPTRDSTIAAALDLGDVPMALASNGTGTLAPDKPYAANSVHVVRITAATPEVKADANGTYNGCAAPVNCGIVISDWIDIA